LKKGFLPDKIGHHSKEKFQEEMLPEEMILYRGMFL
jgi:hypothetical protein